MADFQTFADSRSATASAPFAPNPASTSGGSSSPASAAGSLPLSFASGSADDGDRGTNATEQAVDGPAQLMAHWADLGGHRQRLRARPVRELPCRDAWSVSCRSSRQSSTRLAALRWTQRVRR